MATQTKRQKSIGVRVSDDVYSRGMALSERMGIPLSTLATVAFSEYLISKERVDLSIDQNMDRQAQVVQDLLGGFLQGDIGDFAGLVQSASKLSDEE